MSAMCQCGTVSLASYLPHVQAHIDRDCLAAAIECSNKCGVKVARGMVRRDRLSLYFSLLSGFFVHFCLSKFLNCTSAIVSLLQMNEHLQKECRLQSFTCTVDNCKFKVCASPGSFPF